MLLGKMPNAECRMQNANYVHWAALRLVFARSKANDVVSRTYNHDDMSAFAGTMKTIQYALNTNRVIMEPTLCNIRREATSTHFIFGSPRYTKPLMSSPLGVRNWSMIIHQIRM